MSTLVQPNTVTLKTKKIHRLEKGTEIICHVLYNTLSLAMRTQQILQQLKSDCYKAQEQNVHVLRTQSV
jgi:hypothetical protein